MQFGIGISIPQNFNDLNDVDTTGVLNDYIIHYDAATSKWTAKMDTGVTTVYDAIGFSIVSDRVISTGSKGFRSVPFNCNIVGWRLVTDTNSSNSIKISIQKTTNYSVYDEIISTEIDKPQLTDTKDMEDFTLNNWDINVATSEILRFTIDTVLNVKQVHFFLYIASV